MNEKLFQQMIAKNTLVCCGLDPDLDKFPDEIQKKNLLDEAKISLFLKEVIKITNPFVCAYKIQKAFFDVYDGGHTVLKEIIHYVHSNFPNIPVLLDCKIGDIDNTMHAYAKNIFDILGADGVVANIYMGADAIEELIKYKSKTIVVLVKTSNASGSIIQDQILSNGQMLWEYVLDLLTSKYNRNENIIPVLSANAEFDAKSLRQKIPNNMPILLAGIGAQGGNLQNLKDLLNNENIGVFINSSRGILYGDKLNTWRTTVKESVVALKKEINEARK
ncbi:MAG: orotidine-5'-phosphate decarboxylase [Candidatus Nomurabacteria bacterium]|jgi:orotidine-5'-phosphate decarboxylase|nr:orotidine-5'-phosphate decarboxylase [Candidatus Nomurabacteria bacterium]